MMHRKVILDKKDKKNKKGGRSLTILWMIKSNFLSKRFKKNNQ